MISIGRLLTDKNLLGPFYAGRSWDRWKSVLKAVFAEPLTARERELFSKVAGGRAPPRAPVSEFVAIIGRDGGKTAAAAAIAVKAAIRDYPGLRPGEVATTLFVAVDKPQARIALDYARRSFTQVPMLARLVANETADGVALRNGNELVVGTNDHRRTARGRTVVCCVLDEAAFFAGEDSASSDRDLVNALTPALARVPGSLLAVVTSAHRRGGYVYETWRDFYGKDDPDVCVVIGGSTQFNPLLDQRRIDAHLRRDPQAAAAEWLSRWREDLADYIDRATLEASVDRGVLVRPPRPGLHYRMGSDPSGGRQDSFCAAVAHVEANVAMLDSVIEIAAPFNPTSATQRVADLAKAYGCRLIIGDRYGAGWIPDAFNKVGVTYEHCERDRSQVYVDCLALFAAGRVRLVDNAKLVHQFANLQRKVSAVGRERVDHGPHGADDLSNASAIALTLCVSSAGFNAAAVDWGRVNMTWSRPTLRSYGYKAVYS